jgi:hypothetical protein
MEAGEPSQVLYSMFPFGYSACAHVPALERAIEPLDLLSVCRLWPAVILRRNKKCKGFTTKDFAGELFITR